MESRLEHKFGPDQFESKLRWNSELEEAYKKEGFEMNSQPKHVRDRDSVFLVPERTAKIEEDHEEVVEYPREKYPTDSYSFIALGPRRFLAFFLGLMVFFFQTGLLALLVFSKTSFFRTKWRYMSQNEEIDNPNQMEEDFTGGAIIPANTSVIVRITQVLAITIFMILGGDSVKDLTKAVMNFPVTTTMKYFWLQFSCALQAFQGLLGIVTAILLVVTSTDVIDIVLNFTAVHYISSFDDIAFELADTNCYGKTLKKEADSIKNTELPGCILKLKGPICYYYLYLIVVNVAGSIFLALAFVIIAMGERKDVWTTRMLRVEFDEGNLQEFSGCFEASDSRYHRRMVYTGFDLMGDVNASLAYCQEKHEWIFHEDDPGKDPCNVTDKNLVLAKSSTTFSFDVSTVFDTLWFSPWNKPLTLSFIENEQNNKTKEFFSCGAYRNDGVCDPDLNNPDFKYDGGDCCPSTCSKSEKCGHRPIKELFGMETGRGYPLCDDPEVVSRLQYVTIHIDEINEEREKDGAGLTSLDRGEDIETTLTLVCRDPVIDASDENFSYTLSTYSYDNDYRVFSVPLSREMINKTHEVRLNVGAICNLETEMEESVSNEHVVVYHVVQVFIDSIASGVKIYRGDTTENGFVVYNTESKESDIVPHWIYYNDYSSIPSEIVQFESVTSLDLRDMTLRGTIPAELGLLTNLRYIDFGDTWLTGTIPTELGLLTSLTYLNLYNNYDLTGTIPSELGLLANLTDLDLSDNALTGTIPSQLGLLTSLTHLNFYSNSLTGTIPREVLLTNLRYIDLSSNELEGTIPTEISGLKDLEVVSIHSMSITGQLPSVGNWTSLRHFEFGINSLTGTISTEIGLLTGLTYLRVLQNNLNSTIPSEIGLLTSFLENLDFGINQFIGSIPSEIGLLSSLTKLNFGSNQFTGIIPSEIGLLTSLENLCLGNNRFTGTVPAEIWDLTRRLWDWNFVHCCLDITVIPDDAATINPT